MPNRSINPKRERITRVQFMKLFEAFKTHREKISQQCHSKMDIMKLLHAETGCPVASNTLDDILAVSEVNLQDLITYSRVPVKLDGSTTRQDIRTLAQELANVMRELGYRPNASFREMYLRLLSREFDVKPVPVATVPDPKNLNVANG